MVRKKEKRKIKNLIIKFNRLHSCLNIQTLSPPQEDNMKTKYFKKFKENLTCYKYEFSKNSKLFEEIEYDKNYEIIDSLLNAYQQFKDDKDKFFYLNATNFIAVFLHYCPPNKNCESFAFISAKNKSIIRLLEKEGKQKGNNIKLTFSVFVFF